MRTSLPVRLAWAPPARVLGAVKRAQHRPERVRRNPRAPGRRARSLPWRPGMGLRGVAREKWSVPGLLLPPEGLAARASFSPAVWGGPERTPGRRVAPPPSCSSRPPWLSWVASPGPNPQSSDEAWPLCLGSGLSSKPTGPEANKKPRPSRPSLRRYPTRRFVT